MGENLWEANLPDYMKRREQGGRHFGGMTRSVGLRFILERIRRGTSSEWDDLGRVCPEGMKLDHYISNPQGHGSRLDQRLELAWM